MIALLAEGEGFAGALGGSVLLVIAFTLAAWAIPVCVAAWREHPNTLPIAVVTFFLSWTCIGWVVALAWSLSAITRPASPRPTAGDRAG